MKKVIEVNLMVDAAKISGKNNAEIEKFMNDTIHPIIFSGLTERSRGGEVGCSASSDGKGECHVSIRW
jgi:hypothetical protein